MQSLIQFFHLLTFKVRCRLKSEAASNYLGFFWWVLEPIFYLLTFYFVFEVMLNRGGEGFVAFLLCGLIPWLWFNKTVSNAAGTIFNAKGLLTQTKIPVALLPSEVVLQDFVKQGVVFLLLLTFLLVYGVGLSWSWLALIPLMAVQLTLNAAAGFLVAAVVPLFPDLRFLIQTGLMLMMFGSGIFYSYELIRPEHQGLFFLNPMATLIKNYRAVLVEHQAPDWVALGAVFLGSALVLGGLIWFFLNRADFYPRVVSET